MQQGIAGLDLAGSSEVSIANSAGYSASGTNGAKFSDQYQWVIKVCRTRSRTVSTLIYAMSEVDPSGGGRYQPFAVYAAGPRPTDATAWLDPRVAADKVPLTTTLRTPDPLILGCYKGFQILI